MKEKRKNIFKSRKLRQTGFIISLLIVPMLHFLVFWVFVNSRTILLTFQRYDVFEQQYVWFGTDRFTKMFTEMLGESKTMSNAMRNSFASIVMNNAVLLPLAFVCAYTFYKKIYGQRFFRVLFFMPSIISMVALTMAFRNMFNPDFGPIAKLISTVFHYSPDWFSTASDSQTIWPLIWLYSLWAGLSVNLILVSGAMARVPREISESAKIDGAGFWRECFSIVLPLVMSTLSTFFVLGVLGAFGFMMEPMLIAGESGGEQGKTLTIALHIFTQVKRGTQDSSVVAATTGICFSIIGLPLVLIAKLGTDKLTPKVQY